MPCGLKGFVWHTYIHTNTHNTKKHTHDCANTFISSTYNTLLATKSVRLGGLNSPGAIGIYIYMNPK